MGQPKPKPRERPQYARRRVLHPDVVREARTEAVRQIANRERIAGLVAAVRAQEIARAMLAEGVRAGITAPSELRKQAGPLLLAAAAAADEAWKTQTRRALDGEDLYAATCRILLEHGASSYQVAALTVVGSANVGGSRERKAADRAKRVRHEQLRKEIARLDTIAAETQRQLGPRFEDAREMVERRRGKLQSKLDRLSLDRKSSSRTRR